MGQPDGEHGGRPDFCNYRCWADHDSTQHCTSAIGSITPSTAIAGTSIKVRGSGFTPGSTVTFNGSPAVVTFCGFIDSIRGGARCSRRPAANLFHQRPRNNVFAGQRVYSTVKETRESLAATAWMQGESRAVSYNIVCVEMTGAAWMST